MPEINNIKIELTDSEKFAFIAGLIAGLKLQDKNASPGEITVTLDPIGVNGLGTIGLMAEDIQYTGINKLRIPVVTHDVDIEYSGFSLLVSYNNSKIVINSIESGEFGELDYTNINNGKAYARCMLPEGEFKNKPMIVCWLNCTIVSPPTSGNPIELKFENKTGYDPDYCTLLTWVLNEVDNKYYSYFITPTVNKGCKIMTDKRDDTETSIGDEQQISTNASPSLIAMGTTVIYPGKQGLVPIYTNCNKNDNFPYNEFKLRAKVEDQWLSIISEIGVSGTGEWTLSKSESYDEQGNLILDIVGNRKEAKVDNSTAGFIRFLLAESATYIDCLVINEISQLINGDKSLDVIKGDGYIGYPPPKNGQGFGGGSSGWGSGSGAGGSTGGGMTGSGNIWSGSSQDIWVDLGNGNKYPVHLEPGDNNVNIWIPNIRPEDTWEETTPSIEAPGYILIPGGFEWETNINPDAPLGLSSPRIIDRFEIKDVYDIEIETVEPPVDVDNIIQEIKMMDFNDIDTINADILINEVIESFGIEDIFDIDIETLPIEPITYDENAIDNINIEDTIKTTLVNLTIIDNPETEQLNLEDVASYEALNVKINNTSQSEDIVIDDFYDYDLIKGE